MKRSLLVLVVFFLVACRSTARFSPTPAINITLKPLATETAMPSQTPTNSPPTVTVTPQPTTDPDYFRDDFEGALDAQWSWVRESPRSWSLETLPGSLQINVDHGYVAAHNNRNLLLRPAPKGNFQIETQITFRPENNFQFAGLIVYGSDSNFIQAGRAYCDAVGCIGEGFYMDYYRKGVVVKPNYGQIYKEIDPILLRLSREGENFAFEASTDGKVWFMIGSHTADIEPLQVGLVAGQRLRGKAIPATFEYFEVRSLP